MKTIELKAAVRKELGKKQTKLLRKQDLVPCVLYGGKEVVHFTVPTLELRHILYTSDVFLVNLDVDGKKHKAILHDLQFHPVTDKVLHIDFIEVFDDKPAVVSLPVVVTGRSEGILAGGKLRQRRRYLKVRGLIEHLPENLVVDITKLKIGDFIKVENLEFENLELLDPAKAMIVGVSASRISKGMEPAEEELEGEEAAEGEGEEAKAEGEEAAKEEAAE